MWRRQQHDFDQNKTNEFQRLIDPLEREKRQERRRELLGLFLKYRKKYFTINQPLRQWLRSRPYYRYQDPQTGHIYGIKLNTDGDLSRLPRFPLSTTTMESYGLVVAPPVSSTQSSLVPSTLPVSSNVPTSFTTYVTDSRYLPPQNQLLCGSCWAVSVTTVMTDQLTKLNPSNQHVMSPTYALACFPSCSTTSEAECSTQTDPPPSYKCGGGNTGDLAMWISNNGIVSTTCSSYSWCEQNESCSNTSLSTSTDVLNALIPNCQCQNGETPSPLYYITNVHALFIGPDELTNTAIIQQTQDQIKQQLLNIGPVVATFNVLENFMSGTFQSTSAPQYNPQNLYFEYVGNQAYPSSTLPSLIGTHAVAIVGWDVAPVHSSYFPLDLQKQLTFDSNGFTQVPYWIVRNSWGPLWGSLKGYAHHPFFPFNSNSCLEAAVTIIGPDGQSVTSNGVVTFQPQ